MAKILAKNSKFSKEKLFLYGFLIIYLTVILYLCNRVTVWEDEFYTLNTASRKLSEVISQSYHFEAQPPLYFILLRFWRYFNEDIFFARLLSIFFIGLAVWFFSRLILLISGKQSIWLLIVILLNPFTVWAAFDIRPYALIILLSTVTVYLLLSYYVKDKKYYLYLFLLICVLGLYTQYYFVFLILSLALTTLILKGWRSFLKLCIYLIPVIILFLPNIFFIFENIGMQQSDNQFNSSIRILNSVLLTPAKFLLAVNKISVSNELIIMIIVFFILLGIIAFTKSYSRHRINSDPFFERYIFILVSVLIVVLLLSVTAFLHLEYTDKYMAIAFPLIIALFLIFNSFSPINRNLLAGTLSISFIVLLAMTYVHPANGIDFRALANYIGNIEQPGEPILFYRNDLILPFEYYYKGSNSLIPLPNPVSYDKNYLKSIKDTIELQSVLDRLDLKTKSYFLISDDKMEYAYNINFNRAMVNNYLSAHFNISLDSMYYTKVSDSYIRIRRLEKK